MREGHTEKTKKRLCTPISELSIRLSTGHEFINVPSFLLCAEIDYSTGCLCSTLQNPLILTAHSCMMTMTCILHNNDSLTCGASLLPFLRNCLAHTALNSKSVSATAVKQDDIPFGVCACTL